TPGANTSSARSAAPTITHPHGPRSLNHCVIICASAGHLGYDVGSRLTNGGCAAGRDDDVRVELGASEPNTSLAIWPIPPSEPISADASIGISTTLLFGAEPICAIAS